MVVSYLYAYAWTYTGDDDQLHHVAVLGIPPIDSPQEAVRAMIAATAREHLKTRE